MTGGQNRECDLKGREKLDDVDQLRSKTSRELARRTYGFFFRSQGFGTRQKPDLTTGPVDVRRFQMLLASFHATF